jgi:hypothetical protein
VLDRDAAALNYRVDVGRGSVDIAILVLDARGLGWTGEAGHQQAHAVAGRAQG